MKHLGCGGELVEAIVPYCGKCGRSRASVIRENAAREEREAAAPAPAPVKKTEPTTPTVSAPAPKKTSRPKHGFDPDDTYDGKKRREVDHSPIIGKESKRGHELFDKLTELRYCAAGERNEPAIWRRVHDEIQVVMQWAREDEDPFLFNISRGVLAQAKERLSHSAPRRTTLHEQLGDDETIEGSEDSL